jgi:PIN domain nuclease of toxin-antitoxin system
MFVADTHPLLYYTSGLDKRLGRTGRRLFERAESGRGLIHIPSVSLWEAAKLAERRRIELPLRFDQWCRRIEASRGFSITALEWLDVDSARVLPFSDPYDCLIAGTALRMGLPLITRDEKIVASGLVETVW